MKLKRINRRDAIRLLRKAVRKRGADTKLWGMQCVYTASNETPSCLVGEAFYLATGKIPGSKESINGKDLVSMGDGDLMRAFDATLTPGARELFELAQKRQDMGQKWGTVLRWVEKKYAAKA